MCACVCVCCLSVSGTEWLYVSVCVVSLPQVLTIYALVEFGDRPPLTLGSYQYETGFIVLGWLITALIISFLIAGFIIALVKADWDVRKVSLI